MAESLSRLRHRIHEPLDFVLEFAGRRLLGRIRVGPIARSDKERNVADAAALVGAPG